MSRPKCRRSVISLKSFCAVLQSRLHKEFWLLIYPEVFEQHRAQFTHKWEAVVSGGIMTTLPRWAAEFGKIFRGKLWALLLTIVAQCFYGGAENDGHENNGHENAGHVSGVWIGLRGIDFDLAVLPSNLTTWRGWPTVSESNGRKRKWTW